MLLYFVKSVGKSTTWPAGDRALIMRGRRGGTKLTLLFYLAINTIWFQVSVPFEWGGGRGAETPVHLGPFHSRSFFFFFNAVYFMYFLAMVFTVIFYD